MINIKLQPTAVICHDAGGANIILEAMRAYPGHPFFAVMEGPAAHLWEQEPVLGVPLTSLEDAITHAKYLISGTGWGSDLEHQARAMARAKGIPDAAVLDHWVNYAARFERAGQTILPEEIWVTDSYALAEAHRIFPAHTIRKVPNLYLQRMRAQIKSPLQEMPYRILYVLEPLRYSWPSLKQNGEFEALEYFVRNLDAAGIPSDSTLRLRTHPSDPVGKYDEWLGLHPELNVQLDTEPSLSTAISWANCVAGCETMALVIALESGRKVISTLPPDAPLCRLPHSGILHLRQLANQLCR